MEVKNQVLMLGNAVVAEVSQEHGLHRIWLWLGPVSGGIEVRRVQQPRSVDPEEWSEPDHDPQVVERESFPNLEAALAVLVNRGIDTDAFDAVWKSSNPF